MSQYVYPATVSSPYSFAPRWLACVLLLISVVFSVAHAEEPPKFEKVFGNVPGALQRPNGIATDSFGNIFVVDTGNNRIIKFDKLFGYLTHWGVKGGAEGEFDSPNAIALDYDNNVLVVDTNNNRIQKFDNNGSFIFAFGSTGNGAGQMIIPFGLAVDNNGNILVADSGNDRIQKFSGNGVFLAAWGNRGSKNGQFIAPRCVATDSEGGIYICDAGNNRIQKFNGSGVYLLQWAISTPSGIAVDAVNAIYVSGSINGFSGGVGKYSNKGVFISSLNGAKAFGVDVDEVGNLYTTDANNNMLKKFNWANGLAMKTWDGSSAEPGGYNDPQGIASDILGNLFIADRLNSRIKKLSVNGDLLATWGVTNPSGTTWGLPEDIATDKAGNVYVADSRNNLIIKYNNSGARITSWVTAGGLKNPKGIGTDSAGNIYVADTYNHRIQKFSASGQLLLSWGTFGAQPNQFNLPSDVAVDSKGIVYIADRGNKKIKSYSSDGFLLNEFASLGAGGVTPRKIFIDSNDRVYVTDINGRAIIWKSGVGLLAEFGRSGSGSGEFRNASGVTTASETKIFVSDASNHRIQKWSYPADFSPKSFTSIAINGVASLNENSSSTYTATATYSDGSTAAVTPTWSENSSFASITSGGVLTASAVNGTQAVTVGATYTYGGITKTIQKLVSIMDLQRSLLSLSVYGEIYVNEGNKSKYSAVATFSDGKTAEVSPVWSIPGSVLASIGSDGILSASSVSNNVIVSVMAVYSFNGVTVAGQQNVTIVNVR